MKATTSPSRSQSDLPPWAGSLGYYRTSLPAAGYQVVRENTSRLSGEEVVSIDFAGKGYTGTVSIDDGQVDVVVVTMKNG